ncbi:MAG TPA: RHS repeat-associated core domain-containing protein [Parachlamydiaceae bacterium]|nr:RHS repeat-associated core domain-containing protein [Parachlamydiaceae bacterium]
MCHLLLFILLLFSHVLSAEQAITAYLTSEQDSLLLVEGVVNAKNGKLVQIDKDIEIQGSENLELIRYYDGGHHFSSVNGYGVGVSFPLIVTFDTLAKKQNLFVAARDGCYIPFTVAKQGRKYFGKVDADFLKSGYTNCCEALLKGGTDILAMSVEGFSNHFFVNLGNGGYRLYEYFDSMAHYRYYRLVKEGRPNGNVRHFEYDLKYLSMPKRVQTLNRDQSLVLNWMEFNYSELENHVKASNGEAAKYQFEKKKGTAKWTNKIGEVEKYKYSAKVLKQVSGNHLLLTKYDAISKSHFENSIFSTKNVKRPDGRSLTVDYDKKERIQALFLSGVKKPLYTFDYHKNHTLVKNALGVVKRYDFDKERLVKLTEVHRTHHYQWSEKGQLLAYEIKDNQKNSVRKKEYSYDSFGNITETKVFANIWQKGSQDCYSIYYTYSQDGKNLLLSENHNHKQEFTYTYLANTNLIERKLTFADGGFVEREFYQYDINGIQIQKIVDDGARPEIEDLTNVTYRLVTDIEPQLNPNLPGMTLPRLIKESYVDLKTRQKHLIKMVEKFYAEGDLVAEEKTYDANGIYCYSKFFEYNEKKQLIAETNPLGQKTVYQYDESGNKIYQEMLQSNKKIRYVYDQTNHLTQEIEEHPDVTLTTSHVYDAMSRRLATTNCFGQTTSYQYDAAGRETSNTNPYGQREQKEYDAENNVIKRVDRDGHSIHTTYNLYKKPLEIIYPDGSTERFSYNLQGHLIQQWERDGQSTAYDVDYKGRYKASRTYAPDGSFVKETKAVYKGNNFIAEIDAMGNTTYYSYDGANRLVAKTKQDQTTSYEYDALGNLFKTIVSDIVEVKLYDFLNRAIEERTENLSGTIYKKEEFAYDIHGNQTSVKAYQSADHYSETKTLFNSRNEPVQIIDALGNEHQMIYRYSDHLEKETIDPLGRKTLEIFDLVNRLSAVQKFSSTGKLLSQSCFAYDGRDNKTFEIHKTLALNQDYGDYVIEIAFDAFSQKISEKEQNNKITSYSYQNGRLHQVVQPNGTVLTHFYDVLGRLLELVSSDGTIHYRYTYDLNGNLLKSEDLVQNLTTERFYDALNRLIKEKQATGFEVCYSYDALNRLGTVQFENEKIVYAYSPTSVLSASRYKNNALLYTFTQETDWKGNVINQMLPGNVNISCNWDDLGRCAHITSDFFQQSFTYDKVNNLSFTSVQDPLGSYESHFSYDDLNQVTQESGAFNNRYLFDSLNNRRSLNEKAYAVNSLNQLTSDSEEEYTYDKNGNRLSKGNAHFKYDALNRLISISTDNNTIHYKYDSFGRRIEETSLDKTVHYLYQFDTEIAALVNNKITQFRVLYDEFSAFAIELENKVYTPIRNHRGDTCILLDQSNAASTYRYDAFGRFSSNGTIKSPWTFSGQRYDEATKLYHFMNRDYDPFTGRWLTPDPLGFADGPNLYAYVHNNPLIYVDPYGLSEKSLYESAKGRIADFWYNPRFQGACQMFTGCAEMGAGGAIAYGTAGWAAPVGFSVVAHGADYFSTGLRSVITGRYNETATSQLMQKAGVSQNTANFIDNTVSMVATMGGTAIARQFQKTILPQYKIPPNTSTFIASRGAENTTQILQKPLNTNPFKGNITKNVMIADSKGNIIPVRSGQHLTGSPDGKWIQVRDNLGNPTGLRKDGSHSLHTHKDPRALQPHSHIPGITNNDGTPWLPIKY